MNTGDQKIELEMVQRHVREGQSHLKRQRELVANLQVKGEPVELATTLLLQFEASQQQHEAHLARLQSKDGAATDEV